MPYHKLFHICLLSFDVEIMNTWDRNWKGFAASSSNADAYPYNPPVRPPTELPTMTRRKSQAAAEIESRIQLALAGLANGSYSSIRQASTAHNVPNSTLASKLDHDLWSTHSRRLLCS